MLGRFISPVQNCCTQWPKGGRLLGEGELLEERTPGEETGSTVEVLVEDMRSLTGLRGALPVGPRERMVPTYATAESEALHGEPLFSGNILQLTLGESIHEMRLVLYVNGFSLTPCNSNSQGTPRSLSMAWSPFSLVEKCQVKTMQHSAYWAVFKLTVFRKEGTDRCYYFATTGCHAYKERDRWVAEMVTAIGNVTMSLFPPHAITVEPIPGVVQTSTRIMAGYLLQSGACDSVSLFYCELHAYSQGEARLAVYHDEWCEQEVSSVHLADSSTVSTRKGAYCTVFGVDHHRFCARTREEKDLWLRAVSNIKVKLMFDAPDPTDEELQVFRAAVNERIGELEDMGENFADPLLVPVPRLPPKSPRGDFWDPEPIEEDTSDPPTALGSVDGEGNLQDGLRQRHRPGLGPEECRKLLWTVSSGINKDAVAASATGGTALPPTDAAGNAELKVGAGHADQKSEAAGGDAGETASIRGF